MTNNSLGKHDTVVMIIIAIGFILFVMHHYQIIKLAHTAIKEGAKEEE